MENTRETIHRVETASAEVSFEFISFSHFEFLLLFLVQQVDGQWLTFPFPFVHHQPLHIF